MGRFCEHGVSSAERDSQPPRRDEDSDRTSGRVPSRLCGASAAVGEAGRAGARRAAPAGGEVLGTCAALRGGPDSRGLPVPTNALTPGRVGTGGLARRGSGDSHRGPEDGRCRGTPSPGALAGPTGPPGLQGAHSGCSARGAGALCRPDGLGPTLAPTRTSSEGSWSQVWDQPGPSHNPCSENVAVLGCSKRWPQERGVDCPRTGSPRNGRARENSGLCGTGPPRRPSLTASGL